MVDISAAGEPSTSHVALPGHSYAHLKPLTRLVARALFALLLLTETAWLLYWVLLVARGSGSNDSYMLTPSYFGTTRAELHFDTAAYVAFAAPLLFVAVILVWAALRHLRAALQKDMSSNQLLIDDLAVLLQPLLFARIVLTSDWGVPRTAIAVGVLVAALLLFAFWLKRRHAARGYVALLASSVLVVSSLLALAGETVKDRHQFNWFMSATAVPTGVVFPTSVFLFAPDILFDLRIRWDA